MIVLWDHESVCAHKDVITVFNFLLNERNFLGMDLIFEKCFGPHVTPTKQTMIASCILFGGSQIFVEKLEVGDVNEAVTGQGKRLGSRVAR